MQGRQDNYVGFTNDPDTQAALALGGANGMLTSRGRTCKVSVLSEEDKLILKSEINKVFLAYNPDAE